MLTKSRIITLAVLASLGLGAALAAPAEAKVNVGVGIGLGVNYGIYLVSRIIEENKSAGSLEEAIANILSREQHA